MSYVPDQRPAIGSPYCSTTWNSIAMPGSLCALGSAEVAADDLTLWADQLTPGQLAIFYYGPNAIEIPFANGFRCVGGGVTRVAPASTTNAAGATSQPLILSEHPRITAGSTWNFQTWYRDPVGTGSNLTGGLTIDFR